MRSGRSPKNAGVHVTRSICWSPPGTHGGCGVLLSTQDGRLVGIEGDPENRFNRGRLCPRGQHIIAAVEHPQRLKYPLLRVGQRGQNRWRRISFTEAIEIIAAKLCKIKAKFGPESVIFCKGTALDIGGYLPRLCYGFGSPNYFGFGPANGNACYRPRVAVSTATLGGLPIPDLGQFQPADSSGGAWKPPACLLIWGANPVFTNPDGLHGGWITELRKRGTSLIVVDPQATGLALGARHWLQIKPGSDGALALGMINVLFASGLIDDEFCRKWVIGVGQVKSVARKYPPSRVATITGVPAEKIIAAAVLWGQSHPAGLVWGVGVDMNSGCLGTIHGLISLLALTGNLENAGGMVMSADPFGVKRRGDDISEFPEVRLRPIGAEEYPLIEIGNPYAQPDVLLNQMETGQPYPIKAAWIQGTSVVPASFADPRRVLRLFQGLELNVFVDVFLNPAAVAFADIILPAAMYPEKDSLYVHHAQLGAITKVIEPPGECRSDAEIILALGKKIATEYFPWQSAREWINYRLQPSGLTFAELQVRGSLVPPMQYQRHIIGKLRGDGQAGFATPSGKIELRSSVLQELGLDPLPHFHDYAADYRRKHGRKKFPFILVTGARRAYYFASEHRNIAALRQLQPEPLVQMHPDTARQGGITSGEQVRIISPHGSCVMKAEVNQRFAPGVVHCDFGWWFPEREGAEPDLFGVHLSNVNALLPSGLQGPGGFGYPFRCYICNLEKVKS